ncbi:MAG: hypothetical protein ACKVP0_02290 [Pirellulaceae bacterium]
MFHRQIEHRPLLSEKMGSLGTTSAKDRVGKQATFYAFAGDHSSGTRAGLHHFCTRCPGCHPGHSYPGIQGHGER